MAAAIAHTPGKLYPALYLCHGGGPMPLLDDPGHRPMCAAWQAHVKDIIARYGPPKVIAVVSAHYNTVEPSVGGAAMPDMLYDYYGFPKETYSLKYPAPGAPELAREMAEAMKAAGLQAHNEVKRPYDHGVFVPLMLMFPNADIPVVPVSVLTSDDPAEHIRMGAALRPFRERGVFFLGSGASMHHFGNMEKAGTGVRFGDALTETLAERPGVTPEMRLAQMRRVRSLDGFDEAQPPGAHEHLMPLLTLLGTANGGPAKEVASVPFSAANARHYLFEE